MAKCNCPICAHVGPTREQQDIAELRAEMYRELDKLRAELTAIAERPTVRQAPSVTKPPTYPRSDASHILGRTNHPLGQMQR